MTSTHVLLTTSTVRGNTLQSLKPKFPVTSAGTSDKYWANHYAFIIKDFYRYLLLNSCALPRSN